MPKFRALKVSSGIAGLVLVGAGLMPSVARIERSASTGRTSSVPSQAGFRGTASSTAPTATGPAAPPMSSPLPASVFEDLDNGVIRIRMNDHAPIITQMWVDDVLAVPHDNIGADFQMTARSDKGDGYNPTQGGDCAGLPSPVTRVGNGWNALDPATIARQGVELRIAPRNYNEPTYPGCLGPGEVLPYDMRFGVTLGDGESMPRQLMVLDMSLARLPGSTAEPIVKGLSELPVIFLDNTRFRYAYYSVDSTPADGMDFRAMSVSTAGGVTHDSRAWPVLTNFAAREPARAIMLCDRADALQAASTGTCVALYANEPVLVQASNRHGALHDLTLITTIPIDAHSPRIEDFALHVQRRVMAVGSPATVSSAISWAARRLPAAGWSRW